MSSNCSKSTQNWELGHYGGVFNYVILFLTIELQRLKQEHYSGDYNKRFKQGHFSGDYNKRFKQGHYGGDYNKGFKQGHYRGNVNNRTKEKEKQWKTMVESLTG